MKQITDYITITEALAKDVKMPRKGSTVYLLKVGETKAIPVKVTNVIKSYSSWYKHTNGYDVGVELEDNKYGFTGWLSMHYGDPALDKPIQVDTHKYGDKDDEILYVGTSKEAINEYVKNNASKKLENVLRNIKELEDRLVELRKEKDKLEIDANAEITESLKI